MADSLDKFFFSHVINTSSGDSNDDNEIMMVVALLVYDHEENQMRRYKGSVPRLSPSLKHNLEAGHDQLWRDYFYCTDPLFKVHLFRDAFVCQGEFYSVLCTE
jgi:hypothetical protein